MLNNKKNCVELAISQNCIEVFSHFAHLPYAILLDSGDSDHINSRFDIIAIEPQSTLEVKNNLTVFNNQASAKSCFEIMNDELAKLDTTKAAHNLPFNGGWLGYFGYDLGRTIEQLPSNALNDIDLPQMAVGLYLDALIYDKQLRKWFYISQPNVNRLSRYEQHLAQPPKHESFSLTSQWQSNMSQTSYSEKFAAIEEYLKSGDCYQINLAQRFSAHYQGSPWSAYVKLTQANKAPFSSFINHPQGAILSISPERFIAVHDNKVETKPIKGTLPRKEDALEDAKQATLLANSSKDRAENVMIVDLLRNDLGKVAKPGSVVVPSLFAIESFPAVHHLVSTVTSILDEGKTAVDQLEAAFPGGSITGAPKVRAMEIIEELEPHRRSIYCGSIGYISACGNMDTSITIRTLVTHQQQIHCWAGGGIVADSKVELEYQETYDKVNKILPILNEGRFE
ncbi:aminodeoxychorismate synthase component I [Pseudoalteromonas tetraodonis]|uniref:aminodeoxychorismate synthase component I n=1 Tax=Pseudoalteromonas tetraodonis TaxID=43659 RepID=UPI000849860D|nr:aminodeoxychorismate synthase component I [Pseudoalteromonas tetraodonis]ODS14535.1 aminodeoxychorismate synthase, component I [Pseudoalteromonas tetraodonis]